MFCGKQFHRNDLMKIFSCRRNSPPQTSSIVRTGDRHDQRSAGVDGAHGERVQRSHPMPHLRQAAGLRAAQASRRAPTIDQKEEESRAEVNNQQCCFPQSAWMNTRWNLNCLVCSICVVY